MKWFFHIPLVALLFAGCTQRAIISDKELVQIFRDAFVVNAYTSVKSVSLDSLNIYEPIFESYGYTTQDVQYTIGNFSKRKSARLSDIVEGAIKILEREGLEYNREVSILDTVRSISQRRQREVIFEKSEILVTSLKDSTKVRFHINPVELGEYNISFDYLIDSLDKNVGTYRTLSWFTNDDGAKSSGGEVRYQESVAYLQRNKVLTYRKKIELKQPYSGMTLNLVDFMGKYKAPHLKFKDIRVEYTPPAESAEKSYFERMINLNIFSDEFFASTEPTHSL